MNDNKTTVIETLGDWWHYAIRDKESLESVRNLMPATCDRFLEAFFFAEQTLLLPALEEYLEKANWYLSAHISAVIGIIDAAKVDFEMANLKYRFKDSPIGKEFYLEHDADNPLDRDPLAFNRAYYDMRNMRVHYATPLITISNRILLWDLEEHDGKIPKKGKNRWFLRQIDFTEHRKLRSKKIKDEQLIEIINEFIGREPLVNILGRHLSIWASVIKESAKIISSGEKVIPLKPKKQS